jgi:hypothetical protein
MGLLSENQQLYVMSDGSDLSLRYTFATPVDLPSALETLQVQYLDIGETRALVIFNTAILNLECSEGELENLESAEITVYEFPYNTTAEETEDHLSRVQNKTVERTLWDQLVASRGRVPRQCTDTCAQFPCA